MGSTKNVAIIDDSETFYEGLRLHISKIPNISILPMARSYNEAIHLFSSHQVDIAFVDLRLPEVVPLETSITRHTNARNGLYLLEYIKNYFPNTFTIAMSSLLSDALIIQALLHGAKGFIHRDSAPQAFVHVLQQALRNVFTLSPYYQEILQQRRLIHLTDREYDVLHLLCAGSTNQHIAATLGISEGTVRKHVERLREKFHARTRGEVCAKARRLGFLYDEILQG